MTPNLNKNIKLPSINIYLSPKQESSEEYPSNSRSKPNRVFGHSRNYKYQSVDNSIDRRPFLEEN